MVQNYTLSTIIGGDGDCGDKAPISLITVQHKFHLTYGTYVFIFLDAILHKENLKLIKKVIVLMNTKNFFFLLFNKKI